MFGVWGLGFMGLGFRVVALRDAPVASVGSQSFPRLEVACLWHFVLGGA